MSVTYSQKKYSCVWEKWGRGEGEGGGDDENASVVQCSHLGNPGGRIQAFFALGGFSYLKPFKIRTFV